MLRVIEGDTVVVRARTAGTPLAFTASVTVRLLEIDTPETVRPGTRVQCFGPQASAYTKTLLPAGAQAFVVADRALRDRYGRYLLHLWRADGLFVNEAIVATGHGRAMLYGPNDACIPAYPRCRGSREAGRAGPVAGLLRDAPTGTVAPTRATTSCDPAYPMVRIPPPPLDLDCKDVPYRNLEVLALDPHRFDFDRDGVGCES